MTDIWYWELTYWTHTFAVFLDSVQDVTEHCDLTACVFSKIK